MSKLLAHHSGATNEFLAHHGAHLLMLVGPVLLLAGMLTMLELTRADRATRDSDVGTWWLAAAWAASAAVHLAVTPEHVSQSALLGALFLVLGLAQSGYAVAVVVVRPTRPLLLAGVVGHLSVIVLWAATRAVALPGLGHREPVGAADALATALEVGTVVLACIALRRPSGPVPERHPDLVLVDAGDGRGA